jgi:NAD(P)-dependent dehydrogenase (short-subunit alcohol dehydrogenase family)
MKPPGGDTRAFENLLAGKKVFVTGGSRGLGRALCVECARQGADVAFNFASDEQGAEQTVRAVEALDRRALAHQVSVLDAEGLGRAMTASEKAFERIDILINNAGMSQPLPLALMEDADFDEVMAVNVKGTYLASRIALRGMVRRRAGVLLNIGSLAGARLIEAPTHYCASKGAVHAFTRALAKEMARYGIRVNCLAPGLLDDGVGRGLPEHRLADYVEHVSLGRVGTLEEAARCAVFLVSDLNSYMNGEVVVMDGGL